MRIKHQESEGLRGWMAKHVFLLILIPCSILILASGVTSALILIDMIEEPVAEEPEPEPDPDPEPIVKYFSHLTGLEVENKEALNRPATCVMIENAPEARPQSGVRNAGIVYEAIAEGGITRFMTVYQEGELPDLIGPVRSVRLYYAQWAKIYQCGIAHWGGADDALNLIRYTAGFRDADQFFNPSAYWRLAGRAAPHNGYTNAERQKALNASRGFGASEFVGFPRAIAGKLPTRSEVKATTISMKISSALFSVNYAYDAVSNSYLRAHDSGGAHMDRDVSDVRTQNAPKVVIAMMVGEVARGGGPYINAVAIDTGVAHIFQNGEYIAGSWTKSSVDTELEFHDGAGKPIVFIPGQIWISAVPKTKAVSWQ